MFKFDTLGQEMVGELSNLIKEHVILTDCRGFIQASTEDERINQFHEGALLSIRKKTMMYMNEDEVRGLRGVRKGIVLPIIIDEEPIAVLGITGEPELIKPQAQLILRVAELFIQDSLKRKQQEEKIRDLEFFVFDWLTASKKDDRFLNWGSLLGIEVELYRQVVVLEVTDMTEQFSINEMEMFSSIQNIHLSLKMIRWAQNKVLLLLPEMNQDVLKQELETLLLHIKRRKKVHAVAGVGGVAHYLDLSKSFMQAERAVNVSKKVNRIVFEYELRFEIIIESISEQTKSEFLSRTVSPLIKEPELLRNLVIWFSENQSMQNTAHQLHIHKNTLAYRLQKVEQLTGLSVSKTHDVFLLYFGLCLLGELPFIEKVIEE